MVMIDGMARLLPGVLGDEESAQQDSFMEGLLDFPHYTRPEKLFDQSVPEVLLGGDHEAIRKWRLKQSLGRTWLRRPDLLEKETLTNEQTALLEEFIAECGQD
jgi:tRNA (guanine37-N1)-methyltransferase